MASRVRPRLGGLVAFSSELLAMPNPPQVALPDADQQIE
jgi:hypothetical protein